MQQGRQLLIMPIRRWLICLFSSALLALGGCGNDFPAEYPEYQPFFRLAPDKKETAIFEFSLDQQIDLMILGWTRSHPSLHLYFQVAQNGEPVVPLLIQRMSKVHDMGALRAITVCLYEVDLRHFEWTTHPKYTDMFEQALNEKSDSAIQREIRAILETGKLHPFFKGLKHGQNVAE